jgi:dUTP pyrophosphatase
MQFDLDGMAAKALLTEDPNSGYTMEDFNEEFGGTGLSEMSFDQDDYKLKLKFSNKSSNQDPDYATSGASGFDLRANLDSPIKIGVGKRAMVPTGLFFEIPENFEIQVRPRSGLAAKNGVTVLNTPGTVDADYRGEVKVILINLGDEDFVIQHGDRIAQAVMCAVTAKNIVKLIKVTDVSTDTDRGSGGFGSTGVK